jgi:hypothetical protein
VREISIFDLSEPAYTESIQIASGLLPEADRAADAIPAMARRFGGAHRRPTGGEWFDAVSHRMWGDVYHTRAVTVYLYFSGFEYFEFKYPD